MEFVPLGDSALIVRLAGDFASAPKEALRAVLQTQRQLEAAAIPGILECAPAYNSLGVFFDPSRVRRDDAAHESAFEALRAQLSSVLGESAAALKAQRRTTSVKIPVCYETEFAPDLEEVASRAGLSTADVIRLHAGAKYRVHCLGFMPGFPYLGGLPFALATPRRDTPRKKVPRGAVGIGGAQTGIYPTESPGGWNLIGRTPLELFDVRNPSPSLLRVGDDVRFRSITREEFDSLARADERLAE